MFYMLYVICFLTTEKKVHEWNPLVKVRMPSD